MTLGRFEWSFVLKKINFNDGVLAGPSNSYKNYSSSKPRQLEG
tara:strand:+ start:683 stop:811 length:129 start_codon:yes stop_codon:yes gene_type:complete